MASAQLGYGVCALILLVHCRLKRGRQNCRRDLVGVDMVKESTVAIGVVTDAKVTDANGQASSKKIFGPSAQGRLCHPASEKLPTW